MTRRLHIRYPLLIVGLMVMLLAAWAGLIRMGWQFPHVRSAAAEHGALMVCGFLGTVIGLERAVALGTLYASGWRRVAVYAPALFSALGAVALLFGQQTAGMALLLAAGVGLVVLTIRIFMAQPVAYNAVIAVGAGLWAWGNLLWLLGQPTFDVVWWWAGFLVLTVAGERLEMSRLVRTPRAAQRIFLLVVGIYIAGLALIWPAGQPEAGVRVCGAALLALALWLLRYDLARRTVRASGLTRFIAVNLLLGYFWLALSGLLALWFGRQVAGPYYDAMLHTLFVGFVFGLIFGHAPVIFPALLGIQMEYTPWYYAHVIALQIALSLRVFGDLAGLPLVRRWGGLLSFIALLMFLFDTLRSVRSPARTDSRVSQAGPSAVAGFQVSEGKVVNEHPQTGGRDRGL